MNEIKLDLRIDQDEIKKQFQKELQARAISLMNKKIASLFHNKHTQGASYSSYGVEDPDTGLALKIVNDAITEVIMDPKLHEYIQQRAQEIFQVKLDEAIDKAVAHKAKRIAFQQLTKKQE